MLVTVTFITFVVIPIMHFNISELAVLLYLHFWYLFLFAGAGHVSFHIVMQSHKSAVAGYEDRGSSMENRTHTHGNLNDLTLPDIM
jgi:hypothetical protein